MMQSLEARNLMAVIIQGTDGDDIIINDTGMDAVILGGKGNDYIVGGPGNDVIFGDDGNDIIRDNGGNNTLFGGKGDDNLWGFGVFDQLFGDDGNDVLYAIVADPNYFDGGKGKDIIIGRAIDAIVDDPLTDTVVRFGIADPGVVVDGVLYVSGSRVVVREGGAIIDGKFVLFDTKNVKFIAGIGTSNGDSFTNNTGIGSVFYGTGGRDTLIGGRGFDVLKGGADNDVIIGDYSNKFDVGDDLSGDGGVDIIIGSGILRVDVGDIVLPRKKFVVLT